MRIDLYSSDGTKLSVPPLEGTAIAGFSYTMAEKKIGSFSLSVPLGEGEEVQPGRRIYVYNGSEGLIFKGQIDNVETVIQGETKMMAVSGWTMARLKLGKKTTLNRRFDNASLSTILSALLSGTGYSAGSVDTPLTNLTIPLFGNTLWDALGKVADGFGYLMREDVINDTIDMGAFGDSSGLTFGNVEAHSQGLSDNPNFAVITGLKVKARTTEVYNKIIPLGQQQGIASTANAPYLTLENSTRTSPYTIQTGVNPDGTTYWYITDSTSVAAHGECERYLPVSFVAPLGTSTTDLQRSANTLYDLAVTALQRERDEQVAYEVDVVGLKHRVGGAYTFEVGQKVRLQYHGTVTTETGRDVLLDVDEDLYIMEATRTFSDSGADRWRLTVSTISRIVPGTNDILTDFVSRLTGQQVVPIPFVIFGDGVMRMDNDGMQHKMTSGGDTFAQYWVPSLTDTPALSSPNISARGGYASGIRAAYTLRNMWDSNDANSPAGYLIVESAPGFARTSIRAYGDNSLAGYAGLTVIDTGGVQSVFATKDGVDYELGASVLKAANNGPFLIPASGAGNWVQSGAANAFGSWYPLPFTEAAVPTSVTETASATAVAMPATVEAGDLLIAFVSTSYPSQSTPGGWTQLGKTTNAVELGVYYKVAAGNEDGTTVNFGGTGCAQVFRILAANFIGTPQISTVATGIGIGANATAVTPTAGRFLSIAVCATTNSATINSSPSGYSTVDTATNSTVLMGTGYVQDSGSSEDPGAFILSIEQPWVAFVVAVAAPNAVKEDTYITDMSVEISGTPNYAIVQLATGAAGAESIIGTYKLTPSDWTLNLPAIIPVSAAALLSARMMTSAAAAAHFLTLGMLNQDDAA